MLNDQKTQKKLQPDLSDMDVKSSIELIDEFTIVANDADPAIKASAEASNQKWREIHHLRISAIQEVAAGRPIVREARFRSNCFWHGILARETNQFYVYELRHHESCELLGESRITKSKAQLNPCEKCADHPQTGNTQGWID